MQRKFTALLAALALAATALAPTAASARDRHGGWDRGGYGYNHGGRHWRDHDDHGDAVAAGAIGLVLGLALGAAASQPSPRYGYGDNCYRCAPPPPPPCRSGCYGGGYYDQGYAAPPPGYYNQGYDDGYELEGGYYERSQCTRRERRWDRYANRYVVVDVPC